MTKIKGWRINRKSNTEILWETTFSGDGVGDGVGEYVRVQKNGAQYHLFIYGGNSIGFPHSSGVRVSELHPTKAQALDFAMKYMRSHTNG